MKYLVSLFFALFLSSSALAFSPDLTLNRALRDTVTKLEQIIETADEAYRDTVVGALESILARKDSFGATPEKVEYVINFLITGVKNNSKTLKVRGDFAANYDGFEIVELPDQILALVRNDGPIGQNNDDAFEYLSSYIFGNNGDRAEIAMTSPVMRMPLDTSSYETAFIMPSKWTMQSLPTPNTDRITIKEVSGSLKAVRRFSGRSSESVVEQQWTTFKQDLTAAGIKRYGLPTLSLYDGPWVASRNRRNELRVDLNPSE